MSEFAIDRSTPDNVPVSALQVIGQVRDHAMFLIDCLGRAASWNPGVFDVLGWAADDWLGQPVQVIFTPEDAAAGVPQDELRTARAQGRANDDRWMMRRDGARFFAVGALTAIHDAQGTLVGYLKVLRDFTASKQAAQAHEGLLQSERAARDDAESQAAALTATVDAIPDGVCLGDGHTMGRCNGAALALFGQASAQACPATPDALVQQLRLRGERDGPLIDPVLLPFACALRGVTSVRTLWATRPGDGQDLLLRASAAPVQLGDHTMGAVSVYTDLRDSQQLQEQTQALNRAETALHQSDEQLRALASTVRDYAIFTIDLDGRISSWHEGAELMKGYTADEAIGMPFAALFTPAQQAEGRPAFELGEAARSGEFKGEGLRMRKDGSFFAAAVVLTALHGAGGELRGYLKLTQDITARKQQEDARDTLLQSAQAALDTAERANRANGEFLANISHELRTPLGAILGWAHVLQMGGPSADNLQQGLAAIVRNARVQVQLIEDLLDVNRLEAGQLRLDMAPQDLVGIIASAVESVMPAAIAGHVQIETRFDADAGRVEGDAGRLQQIVGNLLGNAVKFTPPGGHVSVWLRPAGTWVEIAVRDNGQGIDADFLPHVFDRFQQQDGTTSRRHGGLGLGLSIVRQLTQMHGGEVQADSPGPGQGATFTLRLPAQGRPPTHAPATRPVRSRGLPVQTELAPRLEGCSVLVVDDDVDGRQLAEHVLTSAGAQVRSAASAEQGFALFRAKRPQVIVSDIGMPMHDGYAFMRWVRAAERAEGGHVPAAALTAFVLPEERERTRQAGFDLHLVKPLMPVELVDAVAWLAGITHGTG